MYIIEMERAVNGESTVVRIFQEESDKTPDMTRTVRIAEHVFHGSPPGLELTAELSYLRLEETEP